MIREELRPALKGMLNPSHWRSVLAHPIRTLDEVTGTGPTAALLVLFALNAVDELDRTAFGVLLPDIRDHFSMSDSAITSLVALTAMGALLLQLPIAMWADRGPRVKIAIAGGVAWAVFSFLTGMSSSVLMLVLVRSGAGIGRAVVDPTHNSLLSDYYPVERRASVFSFHRGANTLGQFIGPLAAGLLAKHYGWQLPFYLFAIPTVVVVLFAMRLSEPTRGAQERRASGMSAADSDVEEPSISFAESWRTVWKIESLRRIWYAIPFLAVSIIGFTSLAGLLYDRAFHLDSAQRGGVAAFVEPFQFVGLAMGARIGVRLMLKDPKLVFQFLRWTSVISGFWALVFAWSPNLVVSVIANVAITSTLAVILPGVLASLSLAIPARSRAVGFAVASYWAIPGLVVVPFIGWVSDNLGIRWGMAIMAPVMVIGGVMIASVAHSIERDINDVWTGSAARSKALARQRNGDMPLLTMEKLNVFYGSTQVLFDVSLDIAQGETVALLGTNGAGKSTLLKAISGIAEAEYGTVLYEGRDITHAPPHEIAVLGVGHMPGGKGVFGSLTVHENLKTAAWSYRHRHDLIRERIERLFEVFPVLSERIDETASNLSGGQQQMLALAMNLMSQPKLLMIDELSLGLAPVVVEKLAELVREVAEQGTTVVVVEQSVNVALTLAKRAVFMEKGEVQFVGETAELLNRPDLLRSVFLGKAATAARRTEADNNDARARAVALQTSDLAVDFGGVRAVDEVSLSVSEGEIVGIIGPNGAGKTTLFDLIGGYVAATEGHVELFGERIDGLAPFRRAQRGLGRSFQDARLFSHLSVIDTISVALERFIDVRDPLNAMVRTPALVESEAKVAERVEELIELFDLGQFAQRPIRELSTGTRRVVDLACAVAHSPSVLLLDEPSAGIAQREAEALGPLMCRLRDNLGCAVVVIEHDMPLLASIADRFVAMELGRVIALGSPAEVLDHRQVIASYLGTSAELIARSGSAP